MESNQNKGLHSSVMFMSQDDQYDSYEATIRGSIIYASHVKAMIKYPFISLYSVYKTSL